MTAPDASRIVEWEPRWEQGAIDVVRAVFDEYRFSWDAADYHRDLFTVPETYLATGGGFWVLLAQERVVGCIGALDRGAGATIFVLQAVPEGKCPHGVRIADRNRTIKRQVTGQSRISI